LLLYRSSLVFTSNIFSHIIWDFYIINMGLYLCIAVKFWDMNQCRNSIQFYGIEQEGDGRRKTEVWWIAPKEFFFCFLKIKFKKKSKMRNFNIRQSCPSFPSFFLHYFFCVSVCTNYLFGKNKPPLFLPLCIYAAHRCFTVFMCELNEKSFLLCSALFFCSFLTVVYLRMNNVTKIYVAEE